MMYSNRLVAVVSVAGKIAREVKDETGQTVYLPPGSEYSLKLKNLHTQRAVVKISIDDRDVLDGTSLVIPAGGDTELEGFLNSKTHIAHNRFKLIEKTQEISEHRGDKIADGLVRIEFQFEEPLPLIPRYPKSYPPIMAPKHDPWEQPYSPKPFWYGSSGVLRQAGDVSCSALNNMQANASDCGSLGFASETNTSGAVKRGIKSKSVIDDMITVEGSVVDQKFSTTSVGALEDTKHVIVLQLKGVRSDGAVVRTPLLVKTAAKCHTCGRTNKSSSRHCSNCGTCLV